MIIRKATPSDAESLKTLYFEFRDYEYFLNVDKQSLLLEKTKPLPLGIKEAFSWYKNNKTDVNRKTYDKFIEKYLC